VEVAKRWFPIAIAVLALICSLWSAVAVSSLHRQLSRAVGTDMLIVPSIPVPASAGIATSLDRNEISLWLHRADSNAQTRMSVLADGSQNLIFYDRKGKLRLTLGLDAAGNGYLHFLDETGKEVPLSVATGRPAAPID
jgi:hypothetical protein